MQANLYILDGPLNGQRLPLDPQGTVLGRDPGDGVDLALQDARVSSVHARMWRDEGGWCIEDLGSTNGTSVDGDRIVGSLRVPAGAVLVFGESCSAVLDDVSDIVAPVRPVAESTVSLREPSPHTPLPAPTIPPATHDPMLDQAIREAVALLATRVRDAHAFVDTLRGVADELAAGARAPEAEAARTVARLGRPGGPVSELVVDLDELLEGLDGAVRWLDEATRG